MKSIEDPLLSSGWFGICLAIFGTIFLLRIGPTTINKFKSIQICLIWRPVLGLCKINKMDPPQTKQKTVPSKAKLFIANLSTVLEPTVQDPGQKPGKMKLGFYTQILNSWWFGGVSGILGTIFPVRINPKQLTHSLFLLQFIGEWSPPNKLADDPSLLKAQTTKNSTLTSP